MGSTIALQHCTVRWTPGGVLTEFWDGADWDVLKADALVLLDGPDLRPMPAAREP